MGALGHRLGTASLIYRKLQFFYELDKVREQSLII